MNAALRGRKKLAMRDSDAPLRQPGLDHANEILMVLWAACLNARKVLVMKALTLAEAQMLTDAVVHARTMLTEWAEAEGRLKRDVRLIETIGNMKKQYLDLEGMVKERRNSLSRGTRANSRM
jgi:hypothetical protein